MRILLTGKHGQVGFELQRALAPLGTVRAVDSAECDLADASAIRALVRSCHPDLIVNAAAYTAVDNAESELALAHAVNAVTPGILGEESVKLGAWVVHYSTDYVFDGLKLGTYTEEDLTNPLSVYGRTKRDGEIALQQSGARYLTLRTSWVVGVHGNNFAKTILRLALEREQLNVVADQFGAPTSAALLADVTAQLVRQRQREGADRFSYGLYHLVAGGDTTWCEYARFVVSEALAAGKPLKLVPEAIRGIRSSEYPTAAKRPANSRLDTDKLRRIFGFELPDWQNGVQHVLQQILDDGGSQVVSSKR
ncbi:dTDP-4-dehydrorhamnose reductase subunit, NAD(P)-binding, of dTDP-L-rhamnose synthase [Candidatus Nitrospira nitrosa]|uniref:dTDP-4-dehydrorhamnose reductase n=1 Tax=Candidatus Nitrospira nitrosa TaxID=1742972 RepID=A0A0S4LJ12_9BACT|nr:dTDP-4-dehydrorhamnose reductase [Candidatus Nitrospira nitrosa]CUS35122.1 dTDP-4-dehydrorhamnose reductase subunit, NAD(P)-binding, of dTDP-L-rhamnose synthase [Candidatus Nitrospira nitrosa]